MKTPGLDGKITVPPDTVMSNDFNQGKNAFAFCTTQCMTVSI